MAGILVSGLIGLVIADQSEFVGILQKYGGFTIKSRDIDQVGKELRATVPTHNTSGTTVPLRASSSRDPRAKVIQSALDATNE